MNPSGSMQPEPGNVHLWLIHLDTDPEYIKSLRNLLSDDELVRAERIKIPRARDRFITARGILREILGESLSMSPKGIQFYYGPHGKPELSTSGQPEIHFNLSHSSSLGILAINRNYPVGVDIEAVRLNRNFMKLAERFFSASEVKDLRSLPEELIMQGFYSCWTRKESYLKAIGTGLVTPLNAFDVTLKPNDRPALLAQRLDPSEADRWGIWDIAVPEGYLAALATCWKSPKLIFREWRGYA